MMSEFSRGDIIFVEKPIQGKHGHVTAGNHPAVIVQNQAGNTFSDNLIIAYLTSQLKRLEMPTHVVLQWYPGLKKTSVVQTEQLATISKGAHFRGAVYRAAQGSVPAGVRGLQGRGPAPGR